MVDNRIYQTKGSKGIITTISLEAEQVLLKYKWPGNIRQLENILELAKLLGEGHINLKDLPEEIQFEEQKIQISREPSLQLLHSKLKRFHSTSYWRK